MERKHIADRNEPRASTLLSYRIMGFIKIHDFRHSWIFHGSPWGPMGTPWPGSLGRAQSPCNPSNSTDEKPRPQVMLFFCVISFLDKPLHGEVVSLGWWWAHLVQRFGSMSGVPHQIRPDHRPVHIAHCASHMPLLPRSTV